MIRVCADCGLRFEALGTWQRTCKPCYAAAKRLELADLQAENSRLRTELARRQRPAAVPSLDDRFIRELLMLAHPDKHNGSELANTVTRKLLEMRRR